MILILPKPAIFAHRGSSNYAPENTMAAFCLALQHGADGIELDVKLTADKKIAVIHDQTVDRTTNGHGNVAKMVMADLQKLDAGSHFGSAFRGETIPNLEDVLDAFGYQTYINIELTNYASPFDGLPEITANLVKKHRLNKRIIFSSFNLAALIRLRKTIPEAVVGLLIPSGWRAGLTTGMLSRLVSHDNLHPELSLASPSFINTIHEKGRSIFFYTVNDSHAIRQLFEWGADGIFTDDPPLARRIFKDMPPKEQ